MPVPFVSEDERLLVKREPMCGFYRLVARYGYMDTIDHGGDFADKVVRRIMLFLRCKAVEASQARAPSFVLRMRAAAPDIAH